MVEADPQIEGERESEGEEDVGAAALERRLAESLAICAVGIVAGDL